MKLSMISMDYVVSMNNETETKIIYVIHCYYVIKLVSICL